MTEYEKDQKFILTSIEKMEKSISELQKNDQKFILTSIEKMEKNIEDLQKNDKAIEILLSTIMTKMLIAGSIASTVVTILIGFIMKFLLGA